jgi:chromosome segregation ATPase
VDVLERRVSELEGQVELERGEHSALKAEIQEERVQVLGNIQSMAEKHRNEIETLESEKKVFESAGTGMSMRIEELREEVVSLKDERGAIEAERDALSSEVVSLGEEISAIEAER